ncbi:hypothetical protein Tco_1325608, partial [Tanacetum coccineum]
STARPTRGREIDYGFVSTVDAEERRQRIWDVGYGIRDTWVDPAEAVPEIAHMTMGEVSYITASRYGLAAYNLLMRDRMTLYETVWMVKEEAYASQEAHQTQLQLQGTLIQTQHQVHKTRFQMQQAELAALRETDRRRQAQMVETL